MRALELVPRHAFVSDQDQALAYANRPLSIGHGQTISQPYIVALMTVLLELEPGHRVLEVGTGCGYQTAILAELVDQVFTIEVVSELAAKAKEKLNYLGYNTIDFQTGNGREGWLEKAPFQAILVTAASGSIPLALVDQLDLGGRMVIPIGSQEGTQNLVVLVKNETGDITKNEVLPVSFVPLV
ncbi:MAG: protein-L-isoaspartate O-methyltransferase [Rhodospirillaceae bacterium]|nr:protein-L-isoaspartate O-methyltransferase [Rhodospirillaceae bacterium]